jgi:hypothetical protein
VQFVGIGIDDVDKLRSFARATPVAYPLLVGDPAGTQLPALQVKGLPYTVVIDRNGRFEGSRLGRIDEVTLEETSTSTRWAVKPRPGRANDHRSACGPIVAKGLQATRRKPALCGCSSFEWDARLFFGSGAGE